MFAYVVYIYNLDEVRELVLKELGWVASNPAFIKYNEALAFVEKIDGLVYEIVGEFCS